MNYLLRKTCSPAKAAAYFWIGGFVLGLGTPVGAEPPALPSRFDQTTVQQLVDSLHQGQNATILKIGYFARRNAHPFPATKGFALLESALEKETVGSERWFYLQSVRGFAGLRIGQDTKRSGYEAYKHLFSRMVDGQKASALDVVQRSIYEFVSTLPGNYGVGRTFEDDAKEVLLKALPAHLNLLKRNDSGPYNIPWAAAAQAANVSGALIPIMAKALNDPSMPKTFHLYKTAAEVYQTNDANRAIALLQQARSRLKGDMKQTVLLFDSLVTLLANQGNRGGAVSAQQEMVKLTGQGRVRLAKLYLEEGDKVSFRAELSKLATGNLNDVDMYQTALLLFQLYEQEHKHAELRDQATSLLSNYLSARRTRDAEQELRARLLLARVYLSDQDVTKAIATLSPGQLLAKPTTPSGQLVYNELQRRLEQIKKGFTAAQ